MNQLHDSIIVAHSIIDHILNLGAEKLYDEHISELSKPFSAKFMTDLLLCTLEQEFIRREVCTENEWKEALEPSPCSIDTWARNAVPVRQKIIAPNPEALLVQASDTRSMKSFKSGRSTRSAMGKRALKRTTLNTGKASLAIDEDPQPFPMNLVTVVLTEEEENLRMKKENEIKRKNDEAARKKKMDDEMDELDKKLKKDAAEMKNKPITYDCNGGIMFVNHPRYDAIPKLLTEAEFTCNERKSELPPIGHSKKSKRKFEDIRVKTAPVREQDWVKNMTALGPALFDVIKLNNGVTISDGTRTKYPQITHSASQRTFTRKDYAQYSLNLKLPIGQIPIPLDKKSNQSHDSLKNSSRISSKRDALEEIPEYEGVDFIEESEDFELPLKPGAGGKIQKFGQSSRLDEENPIEKFNKDIVKNKQWGANPALKKPLIIEKIGKKPSDKDLKDIYGDILKKPKDQPFITVEELWKGHPVKLKKPRDRPHIEKIHKKSRPPPPPYGFTMINALPEYEDWLRLESVNKK
jgi:hypothetical protein